MKLIIIILALSYSSFSFASQLVCSYSLSKEHNIISGFTNRSIKGGFNDLVLIENTEPALSLFFANIDGLATIEVRRSGMKPTIVEGQRMVIVNLSSHDDKLGSLDFSGYCIIQEQD